MRLMNVYYNRFWMNPFLLHPCIHLLFFLSELG